MRPRALYIVGAPGAGKSTLLDTLVGRQDAPAVVLDPRWPLVRGQVYADTSGRSEVRLGGPHPLFPGTDRLSMGAHPQAVLWARNGALPDVVVGEGARLGTARFLAALGERAELLVILLDLPAEVLEQRRNRRGTGQNEAWARGAATRARNAAAGARESGVRVVVSGSNEEACEAGRGWLQGGKPS